jgi:hypothetical protein
MRFLVAVLALALAGATPALAQSLSANTALARDERSVNYVTVEDLKAIVAASGHTVLSVGEFGSVSVKAKTPEGLIFHLIGTACDEPGVPGCEGISIQVRYDVDSRLTYEKINRVNTRYWAASVWIDHDTKVLAITRYVILDHGVTMRNVKSNLSNLLAINENVQKEVW